MAVIGLIHQNPHFPHVFESAARLGHKLVSFTSPTDPKLNTFYPGVVFQKQLDIFGDEAAATAQLRDAIASHGIEGLITFREEAVPFTARACQQLGLPGISPQAAENARSKTLMRAALKAGQARVPRFVQCTWNDWREKMASEEMPFPVVVKPAFGFGSIGVIQANDMAGLEAALDQMQRIIQAKLAKFADNAPFLIEQFVGGAEYIVDSISHEGKLHILGIAYKGEPAGPYFEERYHLTAPPLAADVKDDLYQQVSTAVKALGITEGPTHTEVKIQHGKTYIVEIGARIGGSGQVHWLVEQSTGYDYIGMVYDHCLGRLQTAGLPLVAQARHAVSNYNIRAGRGGIFKEIGGLNEVMHRPSSQRFIFMWQPGFKVAPYPDFSGFPGFVLSRHEDFEAGRRDIAFLEETLQVRYES
jgi:biotin carboxylase